MENQIKSKPRRKPNRQQHKRTGKKTEQKAYAQPNHIIRIRQLVAPDQTIVWLSYVDPNSPFVSVGGTSVSRRLRPSAVYDVDPGLGSTTVPGFAEWSSFYNVYRVLESRITVRFTNMDTATNLLMHVMPVNVDPGTSTSAVNMQRWASNPKCRWKYVSGRGGIDCKVVSNYARTVDVIGSQAPLYDDSYSSQTTTIPTNNWYWAIGMLAEGGAVMTLGASIVIKVDMLVRFEERLVSYS